MRSPPLTIWRYTHDPPPPQKKARDFCTLVHYRRLRDGALVVVNRAAEHVKAPRSDKCVSS